MTRNAKLSQVHVFQAKICYFAYSPYFQIVQDCFLIKRPFLAVSVKEEIGRHILDFLQLGISPIRDYNNDHLLYRYRPLEKKVLTVNSCKGKVRQLDDVFICEQNIFCSIFYKLYNSCLVYLDLPNEFIFVMLRISSWAIIFTIWVLNIKQVPLYEILYRYTFSALTISKQLQPIL